MAVGHRDVSRVLLPRGQLSRGPLHEQARCTGRGLHDLAHRADVVRRHLPVLPGQGRRVAGVVHQRRPHVAVEADPADRDGAVGRALRIEPHEGAAVEVELAFRREGAAAGGPLDQSRSRGLQRLAPGRDTGRGQGLEVRGDELATRQMRIRRAQHRARMRVGERQHQLVGLEAETVEDRPAHSLLIRDPAPPRAVHREQHARALIRGDDGERGQRERPVRALGPLPVGRPPVLGADADGRRDVAPGDTDARPGARDADAVSEARGRCRVVHEGSFLFSMPRLRRSSARRRSARGRRPRAARSRRRARRCRCRAGWTRPRTRPPTAAVRRRTGCR